ncbi:MAG: DeoR/GlpR family DNA-binding transcription regulator [Chloroflexi bacterium]|nr:DeoR/GlpR family DNA-binding transcription regulator [Chloroflexota bacterium]MCL5275346.1 DeoR/GlpR family DNA-binding transcription regulator [Chloroflexota bacterium]
MKELYLEERRQEILRQVQKAGRVSVSELSQQFNVSEVTIRADLQALSEFNLLVRTHGGAVPAGRGLPELSLSLRRQQQVSEKNRIGEAGAALVVDGDAIFLDSSSTALAIAQRLKQRRHLTIISNSLVIAQEMLDAPGVTVVMPGGQLRRETVSLIGVDGLDMLRKFNIQKGFFGAHGLSVPEGLTDVSAAEAEVKRPLVAMCKQLIAVLDATKWGRVGLASFATIHDINTVITDSLAPCAAIEEVRARGIEVIVV